MLYNQETKRIDLLMERPFNYLLWKPLIEKLEEIDPALS
jgi:hypothetical protein